MFWITKSGPVSSTWISFGPAILGNTHGEGDSAQEVAFLDADTIHNNQQMMRLVVERISAFSGFGLALAGGGGCWAGWKAWQCSAAHRPLPAAIAPSHAPPTTHHVPTIHDAPTQPDPSSLTLFF